MAKDLETVTKTVAATARALTGADGTSFVLRDHDRCYYVDENAVSPLWKGKKFPLEACISGWSMIHGQVVTIPDIYVDARIPHDAYRPTFVKSLCMVPIRPESAIGAIGNYWANSHVPSEEDVHVLQILANSTAVALENLDLKRTILKQSSKSSELEEQTREIEAAMFSLGHDLRTPVAAMTSLADLIKNRLGPRLDGETAEFLHSIIETGHRATSQIERMLSFYRATNGQIEKSKVNLTIMARNAMVPLKMQFPKRRISAMIQPDLHAYADYRLLNMVVENLLSNAVKYSSRKPESQIEVGSEGVGGPEVTFYVRDNGDGFDSSDAHKLFKPLGRLHEESEFKGTGLGLASVAKIIELHGGSVRAEGRKSQGATFYFSLPR